MLKAARQRKLIRGRSTERFDQEQFGSCVLGFENFQQCVRVVVIAGAIHVGCGACSKQDAARGICTLQVSGMPA